MHVTVHLFFDFCFVLFYEFFYSVCCYEISLFSYCQQFSHTFEFIQWINFPVKFERLLFLLYHTAILECFTGYKHIYHSLFSAMRL